MKGRLIPFEGIDFCGKSVQSRLLYDKLLTQKISVQLVREPGGTAISEKIRDILLNNSLSMMYPVTELLLYEAARSQLVSELIAPALKNSEIIICDRFHDSTTAYQGYGRDISLDIIQQAHQIATQGIHPDLTFVIDLKPEIALRRQEKDGRSRDQLEQENLEFYRKVREGFLTIANDEPDRVRIIDGNQTIVEIFNQIWDIVYGILPMKHYIN